MDDETRIPAQRDLPPGRLQLRREHLVREVAMWESSGPAAKASPRSRPCSGGPRRAGRHRLHHLRAHPGAQPSRERWLFRDS